MELEQHYIFINGWLRATVLGANDGILSATSLVIGVAAASHISDPIILAAIWGYFCNGHFRIGGLYFRCQDTLISGYFASSCLSASSISSSLLLNSCLKRSISCNVALLNL